MKTQWANTNEIIAGLNAVRAMFCKTMTSFQAANFQWLKALVAVSFSKNVLEHYLMLALKATIKEALGADVEVKLLILLIVGYFTAAKNSLSNSKLSAKIKTLGIRQYPLPQAA